MSHPSDVPVFKESMAGALIDSARISVMAALSMLPAPPSLILAPDAPTPEWTTEECLEQAMSWLDAARMHTIEDGAPVTSLHVAGAKG